MEYPHPSFPFVGPAGSGTALGRQRCGAVSAAVLHLAGSIKGGSMRMSVSLFVDDFHLLPYAFFVNGLEHFFGKFRVHAA